LVNAIPDAVLLLASQPLYFCIVA